jgi:hypothetical protein
MIGETSVLPSRRAICSKGQDTLRAAGPLFWYAYL